MEFEVLGDISDVRPIAVQASIRDIARLRRLYGPGRWRKMKGRAMVRLISGRIRQVELHWYEAHGVGRKELKIKLYLDG